MYSPTIFRKRTIVVADDEEHIRVVIKEALQKENIDVVMAENGRVALEKIMTAYEVGLPIDLLITDIRMPILNGIELITALDCRGVFVPVLAMTGFGDKEMAVELLRSGCREYIDKPFLIADLFSRVEGLLEKQEKANKKLQEYLDRVEHDKLLFSTNTRLKANNPSIRTRVLSGHFTFDIQGELEGDSATAFREMVDEALEAENINFLLNLRNSEYISSYGMGIIILLWKRLKEKKGSLCLITGESKIKRKLEELNLQRLLRIFPTEKDFCDFIEKDSCIEIEK